MKRAIKLLVLAALAIAAALWLTGLGGTVELRLGDWLIAAPLAVTLVLLAVLFAVLHLVLRTIGWLRGWPARRRLRLRLSAHEQAEGAVTRALVRLAAGAPEQALLELGRARRLLGDNPQLLLLAAEAERQAGREEAAAGHFRALAAREDSRFLGLRGLLRQAVAQRDFEGARQLAEQAEKAEPGAAWLRQERAEMALATAAWREALSLAPATAPRAALSLAAAREETDPLKAAELERQAFIADPAFAPAVLAHAARLEAEGSHRRARQVLEQGWQVAPHPDIARAWLDLAPPEPLERVKAAEALARRNPDHLESRLMVGEAALRAGLTGRSRAELQTAAAMSGADRRVFEALAALERLEQGDAGHMALARAEAAAQAAPEAPGWRCGHCGTDHAHWSPRCDSCGTALSIHWNGVAAG
ncbi:heme biosynthesis protein HemY [Rhodovarius crocodyli]|uniref:Heme biosynthesis protein HemY n=1 Tax=Rhodovarius crocodyli TaxID=1979269 RepID=A0A437MCC6_9PROT|nr:heme biosynthesis HemY N-terminal domain-containing protein [Rhodovarius crocodyli]RVT95291.1 heme biosynthesis protein HemY [Rhodovarius crocodyli]